MLVLTRDLHQRVILKLEDGRMIVVEVLEIRPGRARLGFDAPEGVTILREEIMPYMERPRASNGGTPPHDATG